MTFEEFFIKKKIDLRLLQDAEPNLYKEFQSHYALMGEKSFDHSKKYWFNRLRKVFQLTEELGLAKAAVSHPSSATAKPATLEDSSSAQKNTKPTGFKPRFKSVEKSTPKEDESKERASEKETQQAKPTGFKPRFKPGITKAIPSETENTPQTPINEKKAWDNETPSKKAEDLPKAEEAGATKPLGFKPRFKPGITKAIPSETENTPQTPINEKKAEDNENPSKKADLPKAEEAGATKPLGFKPRFKPGITKAIPSETENTPQTPINEKKADFSAEKEEHLTTEKGTNENTGDIDRDKPVAKKALGFTPRFKAKDSDRKDKPKSD